MPPSGLLRGAGVAGAACLLALAAGRPQAAEPTDLVVVLTETGRSCDGGRPVLARHPQADRYVPVLTRGISGRLVRVYRWEQRFLAARSGGVVEPAYLLLSSRQGGFPRIGFCLGEDSKPEAGYVDLHASQRPAGAFGAMDQIFPHELLHVVTRQLAGEAPQGGANQVHAIAVRTDPVTAFLEGFAEHVQALAVDDLDADPSTRALVRGDHAARADRQADAYRRALASLWPPAPRARLGFLLWFSSAEQVWRYHGVKANRFAFEPAIPERLLAPGDPYAAYLVESVVPGVAGGTRKSPGRLRASEGAVAAFFVRLIAAGDVRGHYEDAAFYDRFGASPAEVAPIENAYLKIFAVLAEAKPFDVVAFARAYRRRFPAEEATVDSIAREIGLDLDRQSTEIWLSNSAFSTGTTLFDQYRGVPRPHTFDLNAASLVDLLGVPGMTRAAADAVRRAAPYLALEDLGRVPGVTPALMDEFQRMAQRMVARRAQAAEADAVLSLTSILLPAVWRALGWLVVAAAASGALYRMVRPVRAARLVINGLAAALLGLAAAWIVEAAWWLTAAAPLVILAAPAVAWQLVRRRPREAGRVLAAWVLAVLPALVLTQPAG